MSIVSATGTTPTSTLPQSTKSTSSSAGGLANNFQTFLTLLTTQLKNQNPIDPLDTNQFTQQLVQFAQVEQQLRQNDQLSTLISLQQQTQASNALNYVGSVVAVDGQTAELKNGAAIWNMSVPKTANGVVTITSASGQTVYSGQYTLSAGQQAFNWDGRDNSGQAWPDGKYTLSVVAKDTNGNDVAISTETTGSIDSVDVSQNPPVFSMGDQTFTLDKIKRILGRT